MGKQKVFHVARATKTGKTVNIGDFDTVEQAHAAMLAHYSATPKRGQFYYRISEEELEEIGGVKLRRFCMVLTGGDKPYNKRFDGAELKAMAG